MGRAKREVKDFRHEEAHRKSNPPAGIAPTCEARERHTTHYAYDPHLDPELAWTGKAEHASFEVDVISPHIHERISTNAALRAVKHPEPVHFELFSETPLPADQEVQFCQHEVGWANRLIPGDPDAWEKLQRVLKAQIDPEAFERIRDTVSFPFLPGEHNRIAVKVIDFRDNEGGASGNITARGGNLPWVKSTRTLPLWRLSVSSD